MKPNRSTRERLDEIARAERQNNARIENESAAAFVERHMRERLAEIRRYPARNEVAKQEIIERYENDLATWVDGGDKDDT